MEVHLFMTYYNKHVHSQYILHIFSFMQSEENLLTVNTYKISLIIMMFMLANSNLLLAR